MSRTLVSVTKPSFSQTVLVSLPSSRSQQIYQGLDNSDYVEIDQAGDLVAVPIDAWVHSKMFCKPASTAVMPPG